MRKKSSLTKSQRAKLKTELLKVTSYASLSEKSNGGFSVNTLVNYFSSKCYVSPDMEIKIVTKANEEIKKAEKRRTALLQRAMAA
jgi:hypothetical protein